MVQPPPDSTPEPPDAPDGLRARAHAREQAGDIAGALAAYERAVACAPDDAELLADLGRLAGRMGQHRVAEAAYALLLARQPQRLEAVDGLARALRDQHRYAEAAAALRPALQAHADDARLWNTLGTVMHQQGEAGGALAVFEEALRLDPQLAAARYNRGNACMDLDRVAEAAADFAAVLAMAAEPHERAMAAFAAATARLAQGERAPGGGDLGQGWDAYAARLSPDLPAPVRFDLPGAPWTPDAPLAGRSLLVAAEQGLGDEAMFAGVLPDVLETLGPAGRLTVAVEPRLVALFARSFPAARIVAHRTRRDGRFGVREVPAEAGPAELWAPMGALPRRFRRRLADFPRRPYLAPDPAAVARWKAWLAAQGGGPADGGPWAGLTWRSGDLAGARRRHYPALEDWAAVMRAPGWGFVNLQYGARADEIEALGRLAGAPVLDPPGIDLKQDLDALCALAAALDLVVAVPNATAALAAACGAQTWFVAGPAEWPRLGTDGYPWYARARAFVAEGYGDFAPALARAGAALGERSREWTR